MTYREHSVGWHIGRAIYAAARIRVRPGRPLPRGLRGYSSFCTDNASCRCFDCAS